MYYVLFNFGMLLDFFFFILICLEQMNNVKITKFCQIFP